MPDRTYAILAQALKYPYPGLDKSLERGLDELPESSVRKSYKKFVEQVVGLKLAEWEELYTRTLDLNPAVAPYVGYQIWGDSYKRGNYMALLNRNMRAAGIPTNGELPDHLGPILEYLAVVSQPPPELIEPLPKAVKRMSSRLGKSDAGNPYLALLQAIEGAVKAFELQPKEANPV